MFQFNLTIHGDTVAVPEIKVPSISSNTSASKAQNDTDKEIVFEFEEIPLEVR